MIWGGRKDLGSLRETGVSKKGQITAIIILVIVLLAIFTIFFLFRASGGNELATIFEQENADTASVRAFVESCIKTESEQALQAMGAQGGYLLATREAIPVDGIAVPVAYQEGESYLATKQEMSEQMALYLDQMVAECSDFTAFQQRGINVTPEQVKTSVTISDLRVTVRVDYPITVSVGDTTQRIDEFLEEINTEFGNMHLTAGVIIENIIDNPLEVDYHFLGSLGYNVTVIPYNGSDIIYNLIDPTFSDELMFQFASRHVEQLPPTFNAPRTVQVKQGEPFFIDLEGSDPNGGEEGEDLIFSSEAPMFSILPDGKILFTSEIPEVFEAYITLTDPTGLYTTQIIEFEVIENTS